MCQGLPDVKAWKLIGCCLEVYLMPPGNLSDVIGSCPKAIGKLVRPSGSSASSLSDAACKLVCRLDANFEKGHPLCR
jgi:ribosomal protein L2